MVVWNSENDGRLLASILSAHTFKIDYSMIAHHFGQGATPSAIMQRIAKIRSMASGNLPGKKMGDGEKKKGQKVLEGRITKKRNGAGESRKVKKEPKTEVKVEIKTLREEEEE